MQWYYSNSGSQLGPVGQAELLAKISSGEIAPTDMCWREGMKDWQPVGKVNELAMTARPTPQPAPEVSAAQSPYVSPESAVAAGNYPVSAAVPSGLAIVSLVCGILGLVTCVFPLAIPAVICGHVALGRMNSQAVPTGGRGMAIAGLILGYLTILLTVAGIVFFFFARVSAFPH